MSSYIEKIRSDKAALWCDSAPLLTSLDIELTERCNNNCVHCYINLPAENIAARERELTTDKIKNILDEAASLGCLHVKFTGGEPLLRKDFEDIYLFTRKLGIKVLLFTNAVLITPYMADLFSEIPPLQQIEVTLYGLKKETYESVTNVNGSFEAAQQGIQLLLEKKVPFVVKGSTLLQNREEFDAFEAWATNIPDMNRPPAYTMFYHLRSNKDEEKNRAIRKLRLPPENVLNILTRRSPEYIKEMKSFFEKFTQPPGDHLFSCSAAKAKGSVDSYGFFKPCLMLRAPDTLYDLKKGSLKEALTDFFPKVQQLKAENSDYLKRCARCFLKGICEQCPAISWLENSTLDTPVDYFCDVAHTQARHLGLLREDEMSWNIPDWETRIKRFCSG